MRKRIGAASVAAALCTTVMSAPTAEAGLLDVLSLRLLCQSSVAAPLLPATLKVAAHIPNIKAGERAKITSLQSLTFDPSYGPILHEAGFTRLDVKFWLNGTAFTPERPAGFFLDFVKPAFAVPATGRFALTGAAETFSGFAFSQPGRGHVELNELTVNMTPVDANGVPDGRGAFNNRCTPSPTTQNRQLGVFKVT